MIALWPTIARSLDASAATRNLALGITLERVTGTVLWFTSKESVTMTATRKLCDALAAHVGNALTVVIRHPQTGTSQRCYSDGGKA